MDALDRLRAALAGRYAVEREIGRGGMATVYLAHDIRHARPVAIKVLRPDLAASLAGERFTREIHTAARLQHPHILPLFDSGEVDGSLFYVMPYVEGESLRSRLDREKQLSLDEALRITTEVADALEYAHTHNVVHRDIKPENILFATRGETAPAGPHALVTDFGIARAISSAGSETLTQAGLAIGTPSYMSPEQATAESAIDGRTDTYSLGCVLYEMLAGHPPFLGTTAREILARHACDVVPPLRTTRPDLPAFVDQAVGRALAKAPADRYATTAAFNAALTAPNAAAATPRRGRAVMFGVAGLALIVAGYLLLHFVLQPTHTGAQPLADSTRAIAVLPFANVGGDSTNEPFSDGVADELTTALGKVDRLSVMARTSAFSLKRKGLDAREIGRELHVQYILEGSVRRAGNRRRIRADLIEVASGREIWSDDFEHDALNRDVFIVEDSITRSIVRQLLPHISPAAVASSVKRSTESREAHDLYLQGRYFFERRDSASLSKAQDYFQRAIRNDSSYALAYDGLSDAYSHQAVFGFAPPVGNFPRAKEYAARALAHDSTLVEVHTSLAFIALFYDWDWSAARQEFDKALRLNERYAPAHLFHAWYFMALDSVNDAIREGRRAVELDPFSPLNNTRLISFLFYGGRYAEALAQARKVFERDSSFIGLRLELARAYVQAGRCNEALAVLERSLDPPAGILRGTRGYTYAKCGRRVQALAELEHLRRQARDGRYVSHYGLAVIQAGLGNKEQAITELEKAYAERVGTLFIMRLEPAFADLRSDPRFAALVQKVGLVM